MARILFNAEGIYSVIDDTGAIGVGWTLGWFIADTTTETDTYNAPSGGSANSNPLEADAEGRFSEIWLPEGASYKYVLKDADGVTIRTQNDYTIADAPPSFDSDLDDFLAGTDPLPIANGGTASATAPNAIAALGGLPLAGGTMTGAITKSTKGVFLFFETAGMTNGNVFLTTAATPDPSSLAGQVWLKY